MSRLNHEEVTTPPRDAATVLLLRDTAGKLEVLMLRRHRDSKVLGDAFVFPGGKLEATDSDPANGPRTDLDSATLHAQLGEPTLTPDQARGLFVAACRETFEEVAVLLSPQADAAGELARRIAAGLPFCAALGALDIALTASTMHPWTRWITPRVPSMMNRRFDTRFFVAALPEGARARHDAHEAVEARWLAPRDALERYWEGEIVLAPPQIQSLAHLARHRDVSGVLAEASSRPPPLIQPHPFALDGQRMIAYPGDPEHPSPARAMPGPTRLAVRADRFEPVEGFEGFFR
ncbi:MAG: NUDIX hydrolase [Burkholderiaceae bacterium]|nr:NUDIX hydrolase [Burkholderiaceae bacterium]